VVSNRSFSIASTFILHSNLNQTQAMTILPYMYRKAAAGDDASTSLAGSDSSASGGKTDATDSISMDYSDEEDDDVSLCYSVASSTAAPMLPIAIDEGFVVETSVLSLDCSRSNKEHGDNKPRRNLIGQRDLRSFRNSCQKLQQEASPKKADDAANHRIPSIGMGPSAFHVTCLLKEGALYKRGSGGDILGREGWKHRHACLVLAKNEEISQSIDVPILLIYRNNSATMPSNIIPLDSAVIMATPGNQSDDVEITESSTNMANFDIVQAKKSLFFSDSVTPEIYRSTSTVVASRSFAASKDEADAWVEKINTTLLQFEKRKAQAGIFVHKKQLDGNKLTQIVAENHWLDITPAAFI